ncbi:hypothetical protein [Aquifex sp.]
MRQEKKEFIRINLNRKRSFLEGLKSFDVASFKEYAAQNVYPVLFLIGVLLLFASALVSFYMKNKIEDLEKQVTQAKEKKDRLLAEIRALRNKIADLKFEQKLMDYLKVHNEKIIREFSEAYKLPRGIVVQNFSLCSGISSKECDIEKASRITLGEPIVQMDVVAFRDKIDFSQYQLITQTYIEIGGLPIKRLCIQKLNKPVKTAKK